MEFWCVGINHIGHRKAKPLLKSRYTTVTHILFLKWTVIVISTSKTKLFKHASMCIISCSVDSWCWYWLLIPWPTFILFFMHFELWRNLTCVSRVTILFVEVCSMLLHILVSCYPFPRNYIQTHSQYHSVAQSSFSSTIIFQ